MGPELSLLASAELFTCFVPVESLWAENLGSRRRAVSICVSEWQYRTLRYVKSMDGILRQVCKDIIGEHWLGRATCAI